MSTSGNNFLLHSFELIKNDDTSKVFSMDFFIKLHSSIDAPEHDTIICEKTQKSSVNKSLNIMDFCYFIKKKEIEC